MNTSLQQIASFYSGIYAKAQPLANTLYLQVSDFDANGQFKNKAMPALNDRQLKDTHFLQENDILFAAKGANNFAAVFTDERLAVASSSFIVIRLKEEFQNSITPTFLVWQLNQPSVLDPLKKSAVGSSTPAITMQQLSTVMIQIPPIEKQKLIVQLHELHQKEKGLLQRLAQLKETFMQQLLHNSLNSTTNGKKSNTK